MQAQPEGASENALRSMTGFGRGRTVAGEVEIVAEIRAVNHRFIDISVKLPRVYAAFEAKIRKLVGDQVQRGRIDVSLTRSGGRGVITDLVFDRKLAAQYYDCLRQLKESLNLSGEISISDMLTLGEIVVPVENELAIESEWAHVELSVVQALDALNEMRAREGRALWGDIEPRVTQVRELADQIAPLADQVVVATKERLAKRVQELTGGMELNEERLAQEVAYLADRSDVTEELTRVRSHVEQFRAVGRAGSPVGRKLDFLLQELVRESNTVGSKSPSAEVSGMVVSVKTELEKIREQVQNVE